MCYKSPGPRCSSHAKELLLKAKRNELKALQGDPSETGYEEQAIKAIEAVNKAQFVYDTTPEGQRELAAQISATKDPTGVLAMRLHAGIETRKGLLAKIKAKDNGDVPHRNLVVSQPANPTKNDWTADKANAAFKPISKVMNKAKTACGEAVLSSALNDFSVFGGKGRLASTQFEKNVAIPALKEAEKDIIRKLNKNRSGDERQVKIIEFRFPGDDEADSRSLGDFYIVLGLEDTELEEPVNIKYTAGKKPDNSGGIGSFSYALTGKTERVTKEQLSAKLSNEAVENAPPTDYHFLSFIHGDAKPTEKFYANSLLSEGGMIRRYNSAQSFPLQIHITGDGAVSSQSLVEVRKDWRRWYATGLSTEVDSKGRQAKLLFSYDN